MDADRPPQKVEHALDSESRRRVLLNLYECANPIPLSPIIPNPARFYAPSELSTIFKQSPTIRTDAPSCIPLDPFDIAPAHHLTRHAIKALFRQNLEVSSPVLLSRRRE
jgi:hypothetical protein